MANQQSRPYFRFGSFARPTQPRPQRPPAPAPAPQQPIVRPAAPQFRGPAPQATPTKETAPTAPPTATVRPSPTITRPPTAQPQAPPTAPAPPFPAASTSAPPASSPGAPPSPAVPAPRSPPTQPKIITSKPESPQPRKITSNTTPSPMSKTTVPPPQTTPAPRSPTGPQPQMITSSTPPSPMTKTTVPPPQTPPAPRSPTGPQPRIVTSSTPTSPITKPEGALQTSAIKNSSTKPSPTPAITSFSLPASPIRKVSEPSPVKKPASGSRSPPPTEPLPSAVPAATVNDHARTHVSSPRNVKSLSETPPQSPQIKPVSHPPSPLMLPPAQIKTANSHDTKTPTEKQKTMLVQERNEKPKVTPRVSDSYESIETTFKYIGQEGEGKDILKKVDETEESGIRVIRLAGENHGAIMELSPLRNKGNRSGWTNGRKLGTDHGTGNEEENSNRKNNKKPMAIQEPPVAAFMNSNVQGVNNSIVYHSSCTHNDPGVHLSFSRKAKGGHYKDHLID